MTRAVGAAVLWVRDCARMCSGFLGARGGGLAPPLCCCSRDCLGGTLLRAAVSMISASSSSVVRIIYVHRCCVTCLVVFKNSLNPCGQ